MSAFIDLLNLLSFLPTDTARDRRALITISGFRSLVPVVNWEGSNLEVYSQLLAVLAGQGKQEFCRCVGAIGRTTLVGAEQAGLMLQLLNQIETIEEGLFAAEFAACKIGHTASGTYALRHARTDFYRHIGLPVHYVVRSELLKEIKEAVLIGPDASVVFTSGVQTRAVQGMGGIGKTIMARALCEDPDVQAVFSDGILWAEVGKTPDLFARLREWANQLGAVVPGNAPTLNELKNAVSEALQERACLLIADDVWEDEDAEAFRVGGPQCRLVITTRNAHVAEAVGAALCKVPLMALPEAVELLERWGGERVKALPWTTKVQTVDEDLGRLPLAIRLAGPQLQHRMPEEWQRGFSAGRLKLRQGAGHHHSLEATFNLSLEDLDPAARSLYLALTIFKEDEQIPVTLVNGHYWKEQRTIIAQQCRSTI